MIRTTVCKKVFDSEADPYILQKDVILCRSGIQVYSKREMEPFINENNKPPKEKEWYKEYRPANVVVKAKKLCSNLPVTKEHPDEWVTPDNWKELAGGTTGKEVEVEALEGESEGEIGLKSEITFYDRDLYNYYEDNNKEVSLGYTCSKTWVDNPEEVGYDVILDEIEEVNHLAITRNGRGGSSVAVIDSLLGGLKPMRTSIFAWLNKGKQKDSVTSFGNLVFDSLKKSKGETEEELAKDMEKVLDSCENLKDCEEKTTMVNVVRDCFDNKEKALANEKELSKALDSFYISVSGDSLEEIAKAFEKVRTSSSGISVDSEKKEEETKTEDSEKEEEKKDEKEEKKDEKGKNTDSSSFTLEEVKAMVKDSIKEEVNTAIKEALGISQKSEKAKGATLDSFTEESSDVIGRDYSAFLDV